MYQLVRQHGRGPRADARDHVPRARARRRTRSRSGSPRYRLRTVRIATWNVNSLKQRVPRLLPWLDERRAGRRLPAGDEARGRRARRAARGRAVRPRLRDRRHGEATWNGVAILSRVGLDDVVDGARRAARASRIPRRAPSRPPATACGSSRCTCRTAASRAPTTTSTSSPGSRRCGTWSAQARTTIVVVRRHEHRADRRRRLRSRRLRRPDARDRAGARGARASSRRSGCTTSCATAGRTSACSATGTTAPACSTRTSGCGST